MSDTLITYAVSHQPTGSRDDPVEAAQHSYLAAFSLRSTVLERHSSIDHLRDLTQLLARDDPLFMRFENLTRELALKSHA